MLKGYEHLIVHTSLLLFSLLCLFDLEREQLDLLLLEGYLLFIFLFFCSGFLLEPVYFLKAFVDPFLQRLFNLILVLVASQRSQAYD